MIFVKLAGFADEAGNSLEEQISALKENGLNLLELRTIDKVNVSKFSKEDSLEYAKILSDNGVGVWSIGSPLGKVDITVDFESYLEKVKKVCETANIFGAKSIRIFSFFNAYNERQKVIDYLSKMVEIGNSFGVKLCHENEKDIYGDVAIRVKDLMENVKGLKFIYDPANYIQTGENADYTLSEFHSKTEYFHVKDVDAKTDELVPAGFGSGKIDKLVSMIDRSTTLTLEPHLAVFDAFKDIDNTQMKHRFKFENNRQAFDVAVSSLKKILLKNGFVLKNGVFVKGE